MENGSNSPCLEDELLDHAENGVVSPIMVKTLEEENDNTDKNSPNEVTSHFENTKANGDNITDIDNTENDSYTSESDALVIDESVPKKSKKLKNTQQHDLVSVNEDHLFDNNEFVTHSNPFFNESLFELSQLHQVPDAEEILNGSNILEGPSDNNCVKQKDKKLKGKPKPKLREYTQYLGLQPTVQFKCSKCGRAGFESLSTLQDHVNQCNEKSVQETSGDDSCSGFKLTRKVFLCSACGTYYENWNLYVHMLEIHKRFICLYCLGMFSILEDLCQHLQSRHNLQPGHKNTLDEFFNVYKEPCCVVCCECGGLFSEQDNFFDHNCVGKVKNKKLTKQHVAPENRVAGESESVLDNPGEVIENHSSQVSCNNSLNNHIGDNKTLTMETNENKTVVANEEHERSCQDHVNDKNHVANDACENNSGENHLESSFEQDKNTDIKEAEPECTREAENSSKSDMEDFLENGEVEDKEEESEEVPVETRKVPKLSLKIPKFETCPEPDADESDDSEKLTMEVDQIESENDDPENMNECKAVNDISNTDQEKETPDAEKPVEEQQETKNDPQYHIAGSEIPVIELELEQPLDKFEPCVLLQKCLKMTVASCIYCNHARKIAVNGRQLGLHCIAEHRFSAVVNSITAEELIPMSFVNKIKDSLEELERTFFNLETNFSGEAVTFSHLFECLQCYFSTNVHKELYLHNRKFHSKNLLLCIMCKSNFYSYSELICHLCPGQYIIDYDMKFRCCMCVNDDLPSSFRLMVHLRKRHNTCDVCLEMCNTQTRLSNHVWRHKLHHFCCRCGIAYRNKMDIMGHLFWKHGTESVQCKKCLQKKWPHVYHFCVPPASFSCDECLMTFSRAVNLKVHKRIHAEEKKWSCTFEGCEEGFISKKLMEKHEKRHYDPPEEAVVEENAQRDSDNVRGDEESTRAAESDKPEDKPKQMIDVLDLPALNLSESDSSDSEPEKEPVKPAEEDLQSNQIVADTELDPPGDLPPLDILQEDESSSAVIQNIWDNFKNYQESKNKLDIMFAGGDKVEEKVDEIPVPVVEEELTAEVALRDHDYFVEPEKDAMIVEVKPALNESIDHDYCSAKSEGSVAEKPPLDPPPPSSSSPQSNAKPFTVASATKKDSSSSSSSDTDSSSCSCGSSCSCKSSSGSSSSSSDSSNSDSSTEEGRKKQMARRLKRRERAKKMKMDVEEDKKVVDVVTTDPPSLPIDTPIRESDLETTESETDEEFYDEAPQKFAKKILDEKRQQLLELLGPNSVPNGGFIESTSRPPTPPAGVVEEEERKKKKSKSKKRKKRKSERKDPSDRPITTPPPILPTASIISPDIPIPPYYQQFHQQLQLQQQQQPTVAPITLSLSRSSPAPVAATATPPTAGRREAVDSSLRASKRRRVPNKFYGYSSDEDKEKEKTPHVPKWKKVESGHQPNTTPQLVPPITIKTTPAPAPTPTVEPISIRTAAHLSDFRVRRPRPRPTMPPIRLGGRAFAASPTERDSGSESNDSSSDEEDKEEETQAPPKPAQPQLYCYCQCPYDEVSEMIGCDASDCAIEWFHFECVGIMVPPKGQWYCPDCRKKKARRELMQNMRNN